MKKYEKEVIQTQLDNEKAVLQALENNYKDALEEINSKIAELIGRADADMQHVIYQVEYQKALKKQIESILLSLQTNEFTTVSEYLTQCYEEGFLGTMYSLQSQGVPLVIPINQEEVAAAITHETNLKEDLYKSFDIGDLKKKIASEISRGFSVGASFSDMARNIKAVSGISKNKAVRIARTEGHRIIETAASHAQHKARDRGADIVKIWDATLDGKVRPSHARVDGEIKELDEKFSNGLMRPGDPNGSAAEVVNCRCRSRSDARWALEADATKMLGDTSEMTDEQKKAIADKLGLSVEQLDLYSGQIIPVKAKNYADFKRQYNKLWHYKGSKLQDEAEARIAGYKKPEKAVKNADKAVEKSANDGIISTKSNVVLDAVKSGAVSTKINPDKQARHIKGGSGYIEGRSYITGTLEDAQKLVDKLSGTGEPIFDSNGNWTNKERVKSENVIGVHVEPVSGKESKTTKATIIYSKTGSHVVPRKDDDK